MTFANRFRGIGVAIGICLLAAPIALVTTILLYPLWSGVETMFKIESVGHSGPAEWCYLVCYLITLILVAFFLTPHREAKDSEGR